MAKFEGKQADVIIVQLYAPTNDHSHDEIEECYADVKKAFKQVKSGDILIVMGNMNVKVGKEKYGSVVGKEMNGKRGLLYLLHQSMYPRYKYFQEYLGRLVERLPRIIDAGKLAGCVPFSQSMLQEIIDIAALFDGNVMVFVFADADHLKSNRLKVTVNTARPQNLECVTKQETTWLSCILDTPNISVYHPVFIIIVENFFENKISPELLKEISKLTDNQRKNLIICNKDGNVSYQCMDLIDVNFTSHKTSRPLNKLIEEGLETKVVGVLVRILKFIRIIIPRKTEELNQSLVDCINEQLRSYLDNSYVIEDLLPVHQWQCQENHLLTHAEKVKYFHQNLIECISKKTRSIICGYVFKQYGIPALLVNELLNEAYFDYNNKIRTVLKTTMSLTSLPSWPEDDNVCTVCRKLSHTDFLITPDFVTALENYMKDKVDDMNVVKQLEFEIFGWLKMTKVPLEIDVPNLPKLSQEMQKELLDLSPIFGCGTYCGQLILHLSKELQPSDQQLIQKILNKYHYTHGYVHEKVMTVEKKV